jgi:hypothetical protein
MSLAMAAICAAAGANHSGAVDDAATVSSSIRMGMGSSVIGCRAPGDYRANHLVMVKVLKSTKAIIVRG